MNNSIRVLAIALTVVGLAACNKTVKPNPTVDPTPSNGQPTTPPATNTVDPSQDFSPEGLNRNPCLMKRTVNFDLDRTEIGSEFQEMVACHAKFLTINTGYRLNLAGHADERGTREYNLGLGERRNNAVSDMLKAQGASGSQIEGVSYGEEQPTCTESTESCWASNRRVEFSYSN